MSPNRSTHKTKNVQMLSCHREMWLAAHLQGRHVPSTSLYWKKKIDYSFFCWLCFYSLNITDAVELVCCSSVNLKLRVIF